MKSIAHVVIAETDRASVFEGTFICAWCREATLAAKTRDPESSENYGICGNCLAERLVALESERKRRRRATADPAVGAAIGKARDATGNAKISPPASRRTRRPRPSATN